MTSHRHRRTPIAMFLAALIVLLLAGSAQAAGHVWIESDLGNVDQVLGSGGGPTLIVHNDTDTPLKLKAYDAIPDVTFTTGDIDSCSNPLPVGGQCDFGPGWNAGGAVSESGVFESRWLTPGGVEVKSDPLAWNIALHVFGATPGSIAAAQRTVGTAGGIYHVSVGVGGFDLAFARATLAGADPDDFLITDGCVGPRALLTTCDIAVRFFPQAPGIRTAQLVLASTGAYPETRTVSLIGSGIAAPAPAKGEQGIQGVKGLTGDTGPQGPQGTPGVRGPAGPQGPPAQVICRNTAAARAVCTIAFPAGTWKGESPTAHYTVLRAGRVVARGARRTQRRVRITLPRTLRAGRYVLKVRVGHTVLRQDVRVL